MRLSARSPSILLVEDQALINLELCEILTDAGYDVIGPATTAAGARLLLQRCTPSMAIVDVYVRDGTTAEVLHLLGRRKIPFLILSRFPRRDAVTLGCGDAPWLAKPASSADLLAWLRRNCEMEMVA